MDHTDDDLQIYHPSNMTYDPDSTLDNCLYRNSAMPQTRSSVYDPHLSNNYPTASMTSSSSISPSFFDSSGMHLTPAKPQQFHTQTRPSAMSTSPSLAHLPQFSTSPHINDVSNLSHDLTSPFQAAFSPSIQSYDQLADDYYTTIYSTIDLGASQPGSLAYSSSPTNGFTSPDRAYNPGYPPEHQSIQANSFEMSFPDNILSQFLPASSPPTNTTSPGAVTSGSGSHQRPIAPRPEIFSGSDSRSGTSGPLAQQPKSAFAPTSIGSLPPRSTASTPVSAATTTPSSVLASPASAQFVSLSDLAPEPQTQVTPSSSSEILTVHNVQDLDSGPTETTPSATRGEGNDYTLSKKGVSHSAGRRPAKRKRAHKIESSRESLPNNSLASSPRSSRDSSRIPSSKLGTGSDSDMPGLLPHRPSHTEADDIAAVQHANSMLRKPNSSAEASDADADGSADDEAEAAAYNGESDSGDEYNDDVDDADYDDDDSDDNYSPTSRTKGRHRGTRVRASSDSGSMRSGPIKRKVGGNVHSGNNLSAAQALARLAAQNTYQDVDADAGADSASACDSRSRSTGSSCKGGRARRDRLMLPQPVPNLTKKSRGRKVPAIVGSHDDGNFSGRRSRRRSGKGSEGVTQYSMDVDLRDRINYGSANGNMGASNGTEMDLDMAIGYPFAPSSSFGVAPDTLAFDYQYSGHHNSYELPAHTGEYPAQSNYGYARQGSASDQNASGEAELGPTDATEPSGSPPNPRTVRGRRVPTVDPGTAATTRRGGRGSRAASGKRTYVCDVKDCGKGFVRGEHLKRHIRSIHTYEKRMCLPHRTFRLFTS
ncbi:hypothetical protein HGRIS_004617 [Hohenbuehelia grisea]|uniref:C2H2-type domain-containing protein n=1 Tax=Hohenbuehelia grisea TaxID=104357 RepID=A0ABR3JCU8_9AGAR